MRRLAAIVEQMRHGKAVAAMQGAAVRWVRRRRAEQEEAKAATRLQAIKRGQVARASASAKRDKKDQLEAAKAALEAKAAAQPVFTAKALEKAQATRSASEQLVAAFVSASTDDNRRSEALDALREAADEAYGADAAALGAAVREGGGIAGLVACLESPDGELQQLTMALLGNLLTDVFDPQARATLSLFAEGGGLMSLQKALSQGHPVNLFACATLQNLTSLDPFDTCAKLRAQGVSAALAALVSDSDESVSSYATAVLANLRAFDPNPEADEAVDEAIRMRRLAAIVEQMRTGKALAVVQGSAIRWVQRKRALAIAPSF